MSRISPFEQLADYRRAVAEMYARARGASSHGAGVTGDKPSLSPEERWLQFRRERDSLFASHPQSPLSAEQKPVFAGLQYFPYNPAFRLLLPVEATRGGRIVEVNLPEDGLFRMQPFGRVRFSVDAQPAVLTLFWILGYGGGVFLPFRDATNGQETYGGGRYLLDTLKGADLGQDGELLVLDFNFAYNPSCAYNPRWNCPLAPPHNWLHVPIRAGERSFSGDISGT